MPSPHLSEEKKQRLREAFARVGTIKCAAREVGVNVKTARLHLSGAGATQPRAASALPAGKHESTAEALGLPAPHPENYDPYLIDAPGVWLVLSDIHAPYHDRRTIELAVEEASRRGAVGVIINGDLLDSHEISRHDKDPSAPRYVEEVEVARKVLAWFRSKLTRARIVFKEGNHDERLSAYIWKHAPALFGIEGLDLPGLLHLADVGAEFVGGRRVVGLGKLNVIHGHEYPGGATSPVNPARGLYLKARSVALCGHHHQTSEHHARDIRGQAEAAWSLGCCCYLHPRYMPLNNWNHGAAFVQLWNDGTFSVQNMRVFDGKLI